MTLAKLMIIVEDNPIPIIALFNPNQITITKTANWANTPTAARGTAGAQFTHSDRATLSMKLFFDTYEFGLDVRNFTDLIVQLTTVDGKLHRPPICGLVWGLWGQFFQGVLQGLTQSFTLFLAEGTPVRATLDCTFSEWTSDQDQALLDALESADVAKQRVVKRGDTLSSLAAEEYNDPTLWRPIADANRLDDPRMLRPGQVLALPALRPDNTIRR